MKLKILMTGFLLIVQQSVFAQLMKDRSFTKADTLRGTLTPLRTCYDINFYHLDVKVDPVLQYISGSNTFKFTATKDFTDLQFDLFEQFKISKIVYKNKTLTFKRSFNAVFVKFPKTIKAGQKDQFVVYYEGKTIIAKQAPWDGGFVYNSDNAGKPWVTVACQGFGASSWWPTKDHQSDEVDSMLISVAVPKGLKDISNGRLRDTVSLPDNYTKYNWFVSYPINNYNVTLNIGDYVSFSDVYKGEKGNLTLDYWVLPQDLEKAKAQFNADVKPMMSYFEKWFGPYPFYRDGYKLVQTPYLGMEHQSAVAYGNRFKKGYLGQDLSGTNWGLKWDYIIIHESGHEWFGNNITSKDIADMWIHEGFTSYSEAVFVEEQSGKEAATDYVVGLRRIIENNLPIIGPYGVNKEGSGDMYTKGANLLHTIRHLINDDKKWIEILRGLNTSFGLKTTTTNEVINFINTKAGQDFTPVFNQYLRYANIPTIEFKEENGVWNYRWQTDEKGFNMPLDVIIAGKAQRILPTTTWKKLDKNDIKEEEIKIDGRHFYINQKIL